MNRQDAKTAKKIKIELNSECGGSVELSNDTHAESHWVCAAHHSSCVASIEYSLHDDCPADGTTIRSWRQENANSSWFLLAALASWRFSSWS